MNTEAIQAALWRQSGHGHGQWKSEKLQTEMWAWDELAKNTEECDSPKT